jgi:hypothetical protein
MIYFIQHEDDPDGPVKIGYSGDPEQRLSTLQIASHKKLVILGVIPGDISVEHRLHETFDAARLDGEWFDLTDDIRALIETSVQSWVPLPKRRWVSMPSTGKTLLAEKEIGQARRLWSMGFSTADIAKLLGVPESIVYNGRAYIDAPYQTFGVNIVSLADIRNGSGA